MEPEQLEAKINSLPKELRDAISSVEIGQLVAQIGDEEGLMLDQSADLMDETGLVMLGITPSGNFASTLAKKLGIKNDKAEVISRKINDKVFNKIRASLQQIQEKEAAQAPQTPPPAPAPRPVAPPAPRPTPPPMPTPPPPAPVVPTSPIERAANINIIRRPESHSPQYNHENLKKEDVLADLENIKNLKPENAQNFVEHLLSGPAGKAAEVEVKKTGPDPYREQV